MGFEIYLVITLFVLVFIASIIVNYFFSVYINKHIGKKFNNRAIIFKAIKLNLYGAILTIYFKLLISQEAKRRKVSKEKVINDIMNEEYGKMID